jgi:hypothetical protein
MSCLYRDYRRVEGFEDYIVSNYGEVFSTKKYNRKEWRELKMGFNNWGYKQIDLREDSKRKTFTVHVLVGNAFVGKRTGEMTFDHIDRDKLNNKSDNIRLATRSEQSINKNLHKSNKLKQRNICISKIDTRIYYYIKIRRNKKVVFNKRLNVKKYSIEDAIKVRDDFLTTLAKC